MYQNIQKLKENPNTANIGKRWSEEETLELLNERKNNFTFEEIASLHKRTPGSIMSKLLHIAYKYITVDNQDINKISSILKISVEDIHEYINKQEKNITKTKKLKETYYVVCKGVVPGIYTSWDECLAQVNKFEENHFKKFDNKEEADEYYKNYNNNNNKSLSETIEDVVSNKVKNVIKEQINDLSIFDMLDIAKSNINIEKKEIKLNFEQENALKSFKSGKNIFLTGPAGTGKSVTLSKIKEHCESNSSLFGITASTGTAAFLIGGKTIHSFLGIGLAKESAQQIFEYVRYKLSHTAKKLRELQVLIIDEISMLDADLLDKISDYLCLMRKNTKPFGGLQIVLTGDFCQLEPVSGDYCFKSKVWSELKLKIVYLHKLIRQDGDLKFQNILSKLRYGKCSQKSFNILSSLSNTEFGEIKPTILYPRNFDVDKINKLESEKLIASGAKKVIYDLEYPKQSKNKEKTLRWLKSLDLPDSIQLCVGDQVVVTANIDQDAGIVNGTRGIITDVKSRSVFIKRKNGIETEIKFHKSVSAEDKDIYVSYIPLKHAYALSIHRSQGMTLDAVEVDIGSKIFAAGQAYTALSRAQSLDSIKVKNISKNSFIVNESVIEFYKKIEEDVKIKNEKYITKKLNIIIHNIANHINLDNSIDFLWEFIPDDEQELLTFFDGYNLCKIDLEFNDYSKIEINNDLFPNNLIKHVYKIKDYMINKIDTVNDKLIEFKIIEEN
jgi:ATP-dependent DNA helicase PIF1